MKKELHCIVCPMSCLIEVYMEDDQIISIKGNSCLRGKTFAQSEVTCPMRMVSTTIYIREAIHPVLPVILSQSIPKSKIFDIMKACKCLEVHAPIKAGDILYKNIADTGADLIASRSMEMRNCFDQSENSSSHCGLEKL